MSKHLDLGRMTMSQQVQANLASADVQQALARHERGDFGEGPPSQHHNERCSNNGDDVFAVYRDRHGTEFCILTNADRTETQVFLPSDIKNARR